MFPMGTVPPERAERNDDLIRLAAGDADPAAGEG